MALKFATESPVDCVCGQTAIRRTIQAENRMVSYDTHAGAGDKDHFAALGRLDRFHVKLTALERELNGLAEAERKLSSGWLVRFDFGSIHPQACERRTLLNGEATVRAFGQTTTVEIEPMSIARATAASILEAFKTAAEPAVARLKAKRETGDY